ncbi:hypothetical protein C8D77_101282 [Mesorhizobium loti]|uniref:Uncharacterized protein n=1 Tax=Rhizobium loti TaxID=381 RepID=A0A8E2WFR2_RHILI|nr:hypothetical protein [Mesorhizobium loti]PWJ93603.1 hypothetical protein C8D77_101282 [Mesorhizobium loti]
MSRRAIPPPPLRLDDLPMFASDIEIAEAIVGRDNAEKWMRERLPALANKPGFPAIDEFHGGRPVKHVIRFYEKWLGTDASNATAPPGKADPGQWKTKSRSKHPA